MSEKVSLEYFKTIQTKSKMGMLYPNNGISSACGKMTMMHMVIT